MKLKHVFLFCAATASGMAAQASTAGMNETYQPGYLEYVNRSNAVFGESRPVAAMTRQPSGDAATGTPISFDGTASYARSDGTYGGGQIAAWIWDFGDGVQALGPTVAHTYTKPGKYRAYLTVHDATGWPSQTYQDVTVGELLCGTEAPQELWIPTGDGLVMHGWVTVPSGPGPFPVILDYGPYNTASIGSCHSTVLMGYARARVASPGREMSTGSWDMFGAQTRQGGYDAVEWFASQPWSNGKVGLWGASASAIAALLTASARPPHLASAAVFSSYADLYRDMVFAGGVVNSNTFVNVWLQTLTVQDETVYGGLGDDLEVLEHAVDNAANAIEAYLHPYYDDYWRERTITNYPPPAAPILIYGNQRDLWPRSLVELQAWIAPGGGRVVSVPGGHVFLDSSGWMPWDRIAGDPITWFNHYLKSEPLDWPRPPVLTYTTYGGDLASQFSFGRWDALAGFLGPEVRPRQFYLRFAGNNPDRPAFHGLDAAPGTILEVPAVLPWTPTQGMTSDNTAASYSPLVSGLQEVWESSAAVFETPVLTEELAVNGPAALTFYATLTASDMAFTAHINDVWPDGTSHYISKGTLLASHRALDEERSIYLHEAGRDILIRPYHPHTAESVQDIELGTIYRFDAEIWGIHNVFRPGHRMRLALAAQDTGWRTNFEAPAAAIVFTDFFRRSVLTLCELPPDHAVSPFPFGPGDNP